MHLCPNFFKKKENWCISTIFFEIGLKWFRYFGVKETGGRTAGGRDENDCEWAELVISMVFGVVSHHKGSISIFFCGRERAGCWILSSFCCEWGREDPVSVPVNPFCLQKQWVWNHTVHGSLQAGFNRVMGPHSRKNMNLCVLLLCLYGCL